MKFTYFRLYYTACVIFSAQFNVALNLQFKMEILLLLLDVFIE